MNKYSYIAILVAVIIGFSLGYLVLGSTKNKEQAKLLQTIEQRIKHKEDSSKRIIYNLNMTIIKLDEKLKIDSIKISSLEYKILQDGVRTEQRRKEASKFTPSEIKEFILNRYN